MKATSLRRKAAAFKGKYKKVDKATAAILYAAETQAAVGQTRLHWTQLPEAKKSLVCAQLRKLGYDTKRGMWTGSDTIALTVDWSGNGL